MDTINELVKFARETKYEDLPPEAILGAKMLLTDILATSVAGTTADGVAEAAKVIFDWGGKEESSVLVYGKKLPAYHAAYMNSLLAHARDYDEVQPDAVVHTGISVIPTVMAVAEAVGCVDGKKILTTIVVTVDFFIRMGFAIKVSGSESGWIYSALVGNFASALAAGLLLGLNEEQLINALGIVYCQAGGNQQAARDTTLTKRMQPGFAARSGVFSAYLAQAGISGPRNIIDGTYNFFRLYINNKCDREILTKDLGKTFWISTLSYKPYPVCGQCLSPVSTTEKLMEDNGITADDITAIDVGTNQHGYRTCVEPEEVKAHPKKVVEAQFSIPFAIATVVTKGHVLLSDLTDKGINDPEMLKVIGKVHPYVDEQVQAEYPRGICKSKVTIHTTKGDFTGSEFQKGHPMNPFTMKDMEKKFMDALKFGVYPIRDGAAEKLLDKVKHLEDIDNFTTFINEFNDSFVR